MADKKLLLAGPSCVIPGSIPENVSALEGLVSEVGLTFFNTRDCLNYTRKDLPDSLAENNLRYHIHLPLDLNWSTGAGKAAEDVFRLVDKASFLRPDKFVLHPPEKVDDLQEFSRLWIKQGLDPAMLLLENIRTSDLSDIWQIIQDAGLGVCLDVGHILAYDQYQLLKRENLWDRVSLVHVYGREDHRGHSGLGVISDSGKKILKQILMEINPQTTLLLEVFSWQDFLDSRNILIQMADSWGLELV
ncbi:MAG: cobamide remodeling phosphodiesterase CbiR [Desulfonatronovibrionaceae bacterium]